VDFLLLEQCGFNGREEADFGRSLASSSQPQHQYDFGFQTAFVKNPTLQTTIRSDLEVTLFQYFSDYFLSVLMLRNAHPGFYADYRTCVGRLFLNCDSVKCAILACCASNRYMLDHDPSLREVSLRYYTQAVSQVNAIIATSDWACESPSDHLLTTVIFLYINAVRNTPGSSAATSSASLNALNPRGALCDIHFFGLLFFYCLDLTADIISSSH
jgi:hypothetical protein